MKPFLTFMSPNGFTILVGKNAKQNDDLSLRVARANDLWFHADKAQGAHVVMQTQTNRPFAQSDITFAAELAIIHSKAIKNKTVPVTVCEAAMVTKPKHFPDGAVLCEQTVTVYVNSHRSNTHRTI